MKLEQIAQICHETNRVYCIGIGDLSQPHWEDAPEWQRKSAVAGVEFRAKNPSATAASMHQSWLDEKLRDGWRYGPVKDPVKKEHPCMLPYADLPEEQKTKDHLFSAVFDALTSYDNEE